MGLTYILEENKDKINFKKQDTVANIDKIKNNLRKDKK
jgi:hypothetical protein